MAMHSNRNRTSLRLAAMTAAALLVATPAAFAHAFLQHATPAVGATVPAPAALRLTFTERVEPLFSKVTVQTSTGASVAIGTLHAAEGGQQLVVALPKLPAGTYTVTWHVTSVDTHKTQGSFHFTVAP
jgi:copper resistance protein C